MTVFELGKKIVTELEKSGDDDFLTDARYIIENVCNIEHIRYLIDRGRDATAEETEKALFYAEQRKQGKPLQYILGKWNFCGHDFYVGEGVLIPRPETEELVENVLERIEKMNAPTVFDLCSGSGCIGISIKHEKPDANVYLLEKSVDAIKYLEKNKIANGFGNSIVSIGYDVLSGYSDMLPVPDVIVSNPPYINTDEIATLQKEVLLEPAMALDGGEDGLIFYRCLADKWLPEMKKGGIIAVECGEGQAETIAEMFSVYSSETEIIKDFYGADRFVFAVKE